VSDAPRPRPATSFAVPPLVVVTDAAATGGRPVLDVVAAAVAGGARAVLLRDKQLPRAQRIAVGRQLRALLDPVGGLLLVASDVAVAADPGVRADAVHLAAADPWPTGWDRPVGRSCHDRDDVARAAAEGCAYATLSPVFSPTSKPGYGPPLGPDALRDLPLPVLALGGIEPGTVAACRRAGASGVAVLGAIMGAADPGAVAAALLAAWDEVRPNVATAPCTRGRR
jgi:thiamine-phosphate pyrophosphorylase